jgi:hypothetical protein
MPNTQIAATGNNLGGFLQKLVALAPHLVRSIQARLHSAVKVNGHLIHSSALFELEIFPAEDTLPFTIRFLKKIIGF